jgi:hypothetical protein
VNWKLVGGIWVDNVQFLVVSGFHAFNVDVRSNTGLERSYPSEPDENHTTYVVYPDDSFAGYKVAHHAQQPPLGSMNGLRYGWDALSFRAAALRRPV